MNTPADEGFEAARQENIANAPMGFDQRLKPADRRQSVDGSDLRDAYYSTSDGCYKLAASRPVNDPELAKKVKELFKALDAVHDHLNANYEWD